LPAKASANSFPFFASPVTEKPLTPDEFVVLIARHERRVRSFISTLSACRPDVVDEVLQATYLTAWQKLASFTYVDSTADEELVRWMCTIARFQVLTYARRYGSPRIAFDADIIEQIADVCTTESDALESRYQALKQCLEKLPARQREMLSLRYWRGLSIKDLAAQRGQDAGAVYTALSRIRKALEQCIRSSLSQEGYTS
jgi:RNA polymerase sigma-70 factor, ECF subfamily